MGNRDCILISWPARDIEGVIFPIIIDLAHKFQIIVFVLNISKSDQLNAKLDLMKKEKIITDYYITPKKMQGILFHLFLKKTINLLKKCNIKLWLCSSDMQIAEKYISNSLLGKDSKTVCLWPPITYLFMYNQIIARKLMNNYEYKDDTFADRRKPKSFILKKLNTIFKHGLIQSLIHYILYKKVIIIRYLFVLTSKKINKILNRYIYPFILTGQFHRLTKLEDLTQLSNGDASAYIFFDRYEVEVHKKLYRNNNVHLSYVRKNTQKLFPENKILGILSGWETDNFLTKNILDLYVNDFIKTCMIYKTKSIDLRPHPDMHPEKNYSSQIAKALNSKGFECQVIPCESSVIDESLKYTCIAGFASAALRDVRLFNHSIGIIGFESVSSEYFSEPKFTFGSSEGIDWLDFNGNLVKSAKLNLEKRLSVSEIITNVYKE